MPPSPPFCGRHSSHARRSTGSAAHTGDKRGGFESRLRPGQCGWPLRARHMGSRSGRRLTAGRGHRTPRRNLADCAGEGFSCVIPAAVKSKRRPPPGRDSRQRTPCHLTQAVREKPKPTALPTLSEENAITGRPSCLLRPGSVLATLAAAGAFQSLGSTKRGSRFTLAGGAFPAFLT